MTITTSGTITREDIARTVYAAVRGFQAAVGDPVNPPWDDAEQWAKDSTYAGIQGVLDGNGPAEQHQGWIDTRTAQGWVYGPVKDVAAKTHPLLVPYEQLPPVQQAKDCLFLGVVRALIPLLGDDAR